MSDIRGGFRVALVLVLWGAQAGAQSQVPLVPTSDSPAAAASTPAPATASERASSVPLVPTPDAMPPATPAPTSGIPLVAPQDAPVDAGPPTPAIAPAPVDVPAPAPVDVPAPAPALADVDAGIFVPTLTPSVADAGIFVPTLTGSADDAGVFVPVGTTPAPASDAGSPVPPNSPAAGVAAAPPPPPSPNADFVKGDLSTLLGADRLVDKFNRVGVSLGINEINGVYYALVEPQLDLHLFGVSFGLAVPLNLEVLDPRIDSHGQFQVLAAHVGEIRPQDWTPWQQYLRVLSYLTYGHKEDPLYISVGQVYADTLGHGEIMRRYSPNIDINTTRVSAELDAYNDYAGFEALTNDISRWDIIGGLAFVKPAAFFTDNSILKTFSVGATYVVDRTAPRSLSIAYTPTNQNSLNGCACQPLEDASNNLIYTTSPVSVGGVDAEIKLLRTEHIDIKPYVDFSHLFGGGSGFTGGALTRINLGSGDTIHALRFIAEGRYLGADYKPEYFDTFYEVDKYIYDAGIKRPAQKYVGPVINNLPAPATQYQVVTSGAQGFGSNRAGYYLEASYGIRGYIGATLALEGDSATNRKNFIAHLELPELWIVQLFASYYKRDMTSGSDLTTLDTSTIILAGARIKILPILFLNLRAYQSYVFDGVDAHNYVSTQGLEGDIEFGYEF